MRKTNNFKKLLSVALILMMVVSTMVIMPLTASAAELQGEGTEASPYLLSSAEDVAAIKSMFVAGTLVYPIYLEMTQDIALEAEPSGQPYFTNWAWPSSSHVWFLDGNGYSFSGLTKPLFYHIAPNSVISNVNIKSSNIADNNGYGVGAFCTWNYVNNITFNNCSTASDVTVTGSGTAGVGGFVGGTYANITINNCVNAATVKATGTNSKASAGGFVASMQSEGGRPMGSVAITNSINKGAISAATNLAGGMCGSFVGWGGAALIFENCVNTGTVTTASGTPYALAATRIGDGKKMQATNCYTTVEGLAMCANYTVEVQTNVLTAAEAADPANAATIAAINDAAYGTLDIAAGKGNLSTKLQLLNGYGFLLLGKVSNAIAASATEVGFMVNGQKMPGEIVDGKVVVEITDAKVVALDTDYSVALYAVINGVQSTSAVRENVLNPYDLMNELLVDGDADGVADGKYQGVVVVTNAKELKVYATMVTYYNNYKSWIEQ